MAKEAKGFNKGELDLVNSRLKRLSELPGSDMQRILSKVTEDMKMDVVSAAPISDGVSRGNLRNSVYTTVKENKARVEVDTRRTDPRQSSRNFEYGRVVEHGRAGRYKTTPFWYKNVEKRLSEVHEKLRKIFIDIKTKK